jgi:hypothetical protein
VLVAAEHLLNTFDYSVDGACGFRFAALCSVPNQLGKLFRPCLGQVKPVHGLGEAQVGVDTGNDNPCIYGEQLDAHKGDADVDVDDQALVQDRVEDISEAAGRGAVKIAVARLGCDGYEINLREARGLGAGPVSCFIAGYIGRFIPASPLVETQLRSLEIIGSVPQRTGLSRVLYICGVFFSAMHQEPGPASDRPMLYWGDDWIGSQHIAGDRHGKQRQRHRCSG